MVAALHPALQHDRREYAPRPLPLFIEMVGTVAKHDPDLARRALDGLRVYASVERRVPPPRPVAASIGRTRLLQCGASGPPVVLVPSLINPSAVLDLDEERSLLGFLGSNGYRAMLLDWGVPTAGEAALDIAGHIETYVLPMLSAIGEPVHLIGYCLGGTMAIGASVVRPTRSLTLLAAPWHFDGYPTDARATLRTMWAGSQTTTQALGAMPMDLLQPAFWALDPERTVAKFAELAWRSGDNADLHRFCRLEDWANDGAPLTAAVATDLFDRLIEGNSTGTNRWRVAGRAVDIANLTSPALQFVAANDRIVPAETAARTIRSVASPSGHVGMVVGSRAHDGCWLPLRNWLNLH